MADKNNEAALSAVGIDTGVVHDIPEPSSVPFPFMKLPPELRNMVYQLHFADNYVKFTDYSCPNTGEDEAGRPGRRVIRADGGLPLYIAMASKTLYHEIMPFYLTDRFFFFAKIEYLGDFLAQIGPYNRQHLTEVGFDYEKIAATDMFDIREAFRLLGECPNLSKLRINIGAHHLWQKKRFPALATLLKIRDIKDLRIRFEDAYWVSYLYGEGLDGVKKAASKKFRVLKDAHSPAAIKRREAMGITKRTEPRMIFGGKKPDSRAERVERRKKLQEVA
ncbi:MAG: hypothetical protein L6R39_006067 [Caloplaca ligustica]|nr:MAG: hypothetical protein L6R39_006067 [Caloplaca ligustica]